MGIKSIFTRLFSADANNPIIIVNKMNTALDEISSALQSVSGDSDVIANSVNNLSTSINNLNNILSNRFFIGESETHIIGLVLIDKADNKVYIWPEIGTDGITGLLWSITKP